MKRVFLTSVCLAFCFRGIQPLRAADVKADLIVYHGQVLTVDAEFHVAQAVALSRGRILAVGTDEEILKLGGPDIRKIDAQGMSVLPGLYDSHVHPTSAAVSELRGPLPKLRSLAEVFDHIRAQARRKPAGEWIVLRFAFPTRLAEARFPTKAELDEAAPEHPVLYHAGPAGVVNSLALRISGVSKDTPDLPAGVVRDARGEPTGLLRNAYGVLKNLPSEGGEISAEERRGAVKKLFELYNAQGLTSVADRDGSREDLDLYLGLESAHELTVRVNVARGFNPHRTREEIAQALDELVGEDRRGGPTGAGDDWVRIGPLKMYLDGGMLNGTAYMREPWPPGPAYQVTEDDYRGLLYISPDTLRAMAEEAAKKRWRMTAHTAGEGAMDALLDAYEQANDVVSIADLRFCITHANFPSQHNLERCRALGVCADVQPAWLWKDGSALAGMLSERRMRWFAPYKSWLEYTVVGAGSDHMLKLDSLEATNPWNPWLGMWVTLARRTERGDVLTPDECLSREQAIRLYTANNAWLNQEEQFKGSLEPGKLGDLIVVDRNLMTCPVEDVRTTQVLYTIVDGKIVYAKHGR